MRYGLRFTYGISGDARTPKCSEARLVAMVPRATRTVPIHQTTKLKKTAAGGAEPVLMNSRSLSKKDERRMPSPRVDVALLLRCHRHLASSAHAHRSVAPGGQLPALHVSAHLVRGRARLRSSSGSGSGSGSGWFGLRLGLELGSSQDSFRFRFRLRFWFRFWFRFRVRLGLR